MSELHHNLSQDRLQSFLKKKKKEKGEFKHLSPVVKKINLFLLVLLTSMGVLLQSQNQ